MKLGIGGDHAGHEYKKEISKILTEKGHKIIDYGPNSADSVDYPDHVHPLAKAIRSKEIKMGILICGSGNGVAMTANKYAEIRAGLCWSEEIAKLTRLHNNANVLCIPARFIELEEAKQIVNVFLETEFEGGRHQNRVDKINC